MANKSRIVIVTVHGTNDTAESRIGAKWFQECSAFANRVKARLAQRSIDADIEPFLWSGANSTQARANSAEALALFVRKRAEHYDQVHIVGHSHGGNVANEAASLLNWRGSARASQIASVTTVGTPFFKGRVSATESLSAAAFLVVLVFSILALCIATPWAYDTVNRQEVDLRAQLLELLAEGQLTADQAAQLAQLLQAEPFDLPPPAPRDPTVDSSGGNKPLDDGGSAVDGSAQSVAEGLQDQRRIARLDFLQRTSRVLFVVGPLSVVALLFVLPIAWRAWRRILRLRRPLNKNAAVFSIWHPNDEAMALLGGLEKLEIEPFPTGAFARSSRTNGVVWAVRAVLIAVLIATLMVGLGLWLQSRGDGAEGALLSLLGSPAGAKPSEGFYVLAPSEWPFFLAAAGVILAPLLFAGAYLMVRLAVSAVGEGLLRKRLNNLVSAAVRNVAFGRDNEERIGGVATCSHAFEAHPSPIQGELAESMAKDASAAATALLDKYRWKLFAVGVDNRDAMRDLAIDAMTWSSLIHTSYFDQEEIIDLIADRIAEEAGGLSAELPDARVAA